MTDLQDQILDRLVGTRVGMDWPEGPLTIAAELMGGTKPIRFGQSDNDRGAKAEIASRLGYPVLLCEAIQGGNRGLAAEDERRGFAMNIFRTIAPGREVKRMSIRDQGRVAVRLAARTHYYVCDVEQCPLPGSLQQVDGAGSDIELLANYTGKAVREVCWLYGLPVASVAFLDIRTATSLQRSVYASYRAVQALRPPVKGSDAWSSVRESVRLAAFKRGTGEAVACCHDVAQGCGMPIELND